MHTISLANIRTKEQIIHLRYPGSSSDLKSQVFAAANIHGKAF